MPLIYQVCPLPEGGGTLVDGRLSESIDRGYNDDRSTEIVILLSLGDC